MAEQENDRQKIDDVVKEDGEFAEGSNGGIPLEPYVTLEELILLGRGDSLKGIAKVLASLDTNKPMDEPISDERPFEGELEFLKSTPGSDKLQ